MNAFTNKVTSFGHFPYNMSKHDVVAALVKIVFDNRICKDRISGSNQETSLNH